VLGIDDGQIPQEALQVWKIPSIPHLLLFAIAQVLYSFLKKNSACESEHRSQVPHVSGQCELTCSKPHLCLFLLPTQEHVLLS